MMFESGYRNCKDETSFIFLLFIRSCDRGGQSVLPSDFCIFNVAAAYHVSITWISGSDRISLSTTKNNNTSIEMIVCDQHSIFGDMNSLSDSKTE